MKERQAQSDDRDNRRVMTWGIVAAIVIMLGALAYYYAGKERAEVPAQPPPTQSAPNTTPGAAPGK